MNYICIDAGGTKTLFSLFNEYGSKVYEKILPTCHFMQVGYDGLHEVLNNGVYDVINNSKIKLNESNTIISYGLAGYGSNLEVRSKIEEVVSKVSNEFNYILHNDVEIAMEGALGGKDGIVIIAGTGSIAFSKKDNERKRCGGWGYCIGDEGSAYWIGNKVLSAFSKEADGRYIKGALYDIIMKEYNLKSSHELIVYTNEVLKGKRDEIAKLSLICSKAAEKNDKIAIKILEKAAYELASMINKLAEEFNGEQVKTSYIGGVFKSGDLIFEPLKKYLAKEVELIKPIYSAEYGAFLLAKDKFN